MKLGCLQVWSSTGACQSEGSALGSCHCLFPALGRLSTGIWLPEIHTLGSVPPSWPAQAGCVTHLQQVRERLRRPGGLRRSGGCCWYVGLGLITSAERRLTHATCPGRKSWALAALTAGSARVNARNPSCRMNYNDREQAAPPVPPVTLPSPHRACLLPYRRSQ